MVAVGLLDRSCQDGADPPRRRVILPTTACYIYPPFIHTQARKLVSRKGNDKEAQIVKLYDRLDRFKVSSKYVVDAPACLGVQNLARSRRVTPIRLTLPSFDSSLTLPHYSMYRFQRMAAGADAASEGERENAERMLAQVSNK